MKTNSIGNKLGLAGLAGILLSIGMVMNQAATESSVFEANQRAEIQQQISDNALKAESEMRNMQRAVRGIRLARTPEEGAKGRSQFETARLAQTKLFDAVLALAVLPEWKELFSKIKSKTEAYVAGADEQAELMLRVLDLNHKQITISGQWDVALDQLAATLATVGLPQRNDIEGHLRDADGALNAVRAAGWRFFATGETDQKDKIAHNAAVSSASLKRSRELVADKQLLERIDVLDPLVKGFVSVTNEIIEADLLKNTISKNRTLPIAQKAIAEAKAAVEDKMQRAGQVSLGFGAAIMVVLVGSTVFSFMGIVRPMNRLSSAMGKMAGGELDVVISGADRGDEIGDVAKTIAVIRQNAEQKAREEAEAKVRQDKIAAELRKADMPKLADAFEGAVGEIVEMVSSAAIELETSANTLATTAERSQELATAVAAASDEASTNVQSVASATEEMSSSVNEISRQVQESARMASGAVDQARATHDRVSELSKAT